MSFFIHVENQFTDALIFGLQRKFMLHCLRRLPVISHNIRPFQSSVYKLLSTSQTMSSLPVIPTKKISSAGLTLHEKLSLTCTKIEASLEENQEDAFKAVGDNCF